MARTPHRLSSMEPGPGAHDQVDELNRWYEETVLKISVQIEPLELRREFSGLIGSYNKAKHQVQTFNLDEFMS